MTQHFSSLSHDELELCEKQTLRIIVQAMQEYSREAKAIFDSTPLPTGDEITVLGEDLVQYALEVAELYPINKRLAGSIDYKRVRWLPTPYGLFPQALLVDAKAAKENTRTTLQQSQLPMDADFEVNGVVHNLTAGIPNLVVEAKSGAMLQALPTSIFVHLYYKDLPQGATTPRSLKAIYIVSVPHGLLKQRYNPTAQDSFWGKGKESTSRLEARRVRVYFQRLIAMCPWRVQCLEYPAGVTGPAYTTPVWIETDAMNMPVQQPFEYIGR